MIIALIKTLREHLPWTNLIRGVLEKRGFDFHEHYSYVAKCIQKSGKVTRILDIGTNGLSPLALCYNYVVSIDIKRNYGITVLADCRYLPFRDRSFSHVVALDLLEYIEKGQRHLAVGEMKRVRERVLIHSPLNDNAHVAKVLDTIISKYVKKNNCIKTYISQHINCGYPSLVGSLKGFRILRNDYSYSLFITCWKIRTNYLASKLPLDIIFFQIFRKVFRKGPFYGAFLIWP